MKVRPEPGKWRIALGREDSMADQANGCRKNKLRRLPFIFEKVLELPFHADTEVWVKETPESILFAVSTCDIAGDVKADTVETFPGVSKIVIRGEGIVEPEGVEFELDLWRIRLPERTMPKLASASYCNGELVVTVPKELGDRRVLGG
ncbi:hypothetical protein F511_27939 [Dorcoceras hygrometricum]|uniref:SHSP domain-containing protein n=1 Tax=Dorcoceras hygrometricum TaxID=472368 RepID=A0A2Z7CUZ6_9LAMI|nr:hypothetical protein F511_35534 [Dorcoceras hygrometricum]KZV56981.1 hypothetical protein F511_27939 [Dorcoceras hygrometricum]